MVKTAQQSSRWQVYDRGGRDLLDHLCRLRGFDPKGLEPDYTQHLHDPFLLPDMEEACQIIKKAVEKKWFVTVFGDYDADGTPASALLGLTLTKLGLRHQIVLPTRESGYGLRREQVEEIAASSQLLITVDTGIGSVSEIALAKDRWLQVIVLDHHLPGASLPPADAIVDPHRIDSEYPFSELCGCALAFKLTVALQRYFPVLTEQFCKWLLDLVAISTVADMMPLLGENRALVHYGLVVLRQNRRPGLRALIESAGVDSRSISAGTLGFVIGPRLNAAGRLGDNSPAYELLKAETDLEAKRLASKIEAANTERQDLVTQVMEEAEHELFRQNNKSDHVYLLAKTGWPAGVVGLVAGKLATIHCRPVLAATIGEGGIRGSARSIKGYPIVDALARTAAHLETYGGHVAAAGFALKEKNWAKFVAAMKQDASSHLQADQLQRVHTADAAIEPKDLTKKTVDSLERLQPYGLANARPLFYLPAVTISGVRSIGRASQHLKARLVGNGIDIDTIAFGLAEKMTALRLGSLDCLGYLENNRWNGQETLQFQLIDYRPTQATVEWIKNG